MRTWAVLIGALVSLGLGRTNPWLAILAGLAVLALLGLQTTSRVPTTVLGLVLGRSPGLGLRVVEGLYGLLLLSAGTGALADRRQLQQQAAAQAELERTRLDALKKKQDEQDHRLRAGLPAALIEWKDSIGRASQLQDQGRYDEASTLLEQAAGRARPYLLVGIGTELTTLNADHAKLAARVRAFTDARANEATIRTSLRDGDEAVRDRHYLDAAAAYDRAKTAARSIDKGAADRLSIDVAGILKTIDGRSEKIHSKVTREQAHVNRDRANAERETRAAQVYAKLCGDKPIRSAWDGEIVGAERLIRQSANDPDSIDVENCTDPVMTRGHCWVSRCQVRGKNGFGAKVLRMYTFAASSLGLEVIAQD